MSTETVDTSNLSAAEKRALQAEARRLKILARGNERLAKVTGLYSGGAEAENRGTPEPGLHPTAATAGPSSTAAHDEKPTTAPAVFDNTAAVEEEPNVAEDNAAATLPTEEEAEAGMLPEIPSAKFEGGDTEGVVPNNTVTSSKGPRLPDREVQQAVRQRRKDAAAAKPSPPWNQDAFMSALGGAGMGGPGDRTSANPFAAFTNLMGGPHASPAPPPSSIPIAAILETAISLSATPRLLLSVLFAFLTFAVHITGGTLSQLSSLLPTVPLPPVALQAAETLLRDTGLSSLLLLRPVHLLVALYAALVAVLAGSVALGAVKVSSSASNVPFILKLVPGVDAIVRRVKVGTAVLGALLDLAAVYLVTVGLLMGTAATEIKGAAKKID